MPLLRALHRPLLCLWTARPWSTGKDCAGWLYLWQALGTRDLCCFAWCEALVWFWVWESRFEWKWEWEWGWGGRLGDLKWTMYYGCAIIAPRGFLDVPGYFFPSFFPIWCSMLCVEWGVLPVLIVDTGVDDSWCRGIGGNCSALFFFCALAMLCGTVIDSTVCILLNQVLSTIKMRRHEMLVHLWDEECRASVRKRTGNEDTCEIMRYGWLTKEGAWCFQDIMHCGRFFCLWTCLSLYILLF